MIAYSRGDVVLVSFVFSDESGRKLRPAVVISSAAYNRAREEVVCGHYQQRQTASLWRSSDHQLEGGGIALPFPGDRDLADHQADNNRSEAWSPAETRLRGYRPTSPPVSWPVAPA